MASGADHRAHPTHLVPHRPLHSCHGLGTLASTWGSAQRPPSLRGHAGAQSNQLPLPPPAPVCLWSSELKDAERQKPTPTCSRPAAPRPGRAPGVRGQASPRAGLPSPSPPCVLLHQPCSPPAPELRKASLPACPGFHTQPRAQAPAAATQAWSGLHPRPRDLRCGPPASEALVRMHMPAVPGAGGAVG